MPSGETVHPGKPPEAPVPFTQWALIGILLILAFGAMSLAKGLLVPIITALMIALVFSPVRRALGIVVFAFADPHALTPRTEAVRP
mgnify:CR=1 FL=1